MTKITRIDIETIDQIRNDLHFCTCKINENCLTCEDNLKKINSQNIWVDGFIQYELIKGIYKDLDIIANFDLEQKLAWIYIFNSSDCNELNMVATAKIKKFTNYDTQYKIDINTIEYCNNVLLKPKYIYCDFTKN